MLYRAGPVLYRASCFLKKILSSANKESETEDDLSIIEDAKASVSHFFIPFSNKLLVWYFSYGIIKSKKKNFQLEETQVTATDTDSEKEEESLYVKKKKE